MLQTLDDTDGNALIQKLRQQSIDNREKNELYVARKTFEADQVRCWLFSGNFFPYSIVYRPILTRTFSEFFNTTQSATFGPFDRQVLIMNTDGRTYTLLQNPVAMRLKKAGFIDNQRGFIKQPTQAELDAAAVPEEGFFSGLLGGS
jgi:hypothetical protein